MTVRSFVMSFAFAAFCSSAFCTPESDAPSGPRPFFMPEWKRKEMKTLIAREQWAKESYETIVKQADKGNHYWSAFMFAFEGDRKYVPAAEKWLLSISAGWIKHRGADLNNPEFFKGGIPGKGGGLSDVFYHFDATPLIVYDWVHDGLSAESREEIRKGLWTGAEFRKQAMTRWWHTPNLMIKPTFFVAMAGMALQEKDQIEWGFYREGQHFPGATPSGAHGGYFRVMDSMLNGGGPWHEAPVYAISHGALQIIATMSFYRRLYDGKDWWQYKTPSGGSAHALMDYYIDSAWPPEIRDDGSRVYRCANYGHGSESSYEGGLYLHGLLKQFELAYAASLGDPRYGAFLKLLQPKYTPNIFDMPPLPDKAVLPPAPSSIWEGLGVAMLRADESPEYWEDPDGIAAFMIMTKRFSHDNHDKLSLTLHGAGHLLYVDYTALQYEKLSIGWSGNSVSHNTMVVDEQDTAGAEPMVRHEFTPEVKYLAIAASGLFDGVNQTRALLLSREYLLDVFQADSLVPHTYDYLLHSFGRAEPVNPRQFAKANPPDRYTVAMVNSASASMKEAWALDFVLRTEDGAPRAAVRAHVAADPSTTVYTGNWGGKLAEIVSERAKGKRELDPLGMLIARRENRRDTAFVVAHEPYRPDSKPVISAITVLAQSADALVVRVKGQGFTDYAAVSFGAQEKRPEHSLVSGSGERFAFKDYGWLRVADDGSASARGGWTGFEVPGKANSLTLNGKPAKSESKGGMIVHGKTPDPEPVARADDPPFAMAARSEPVRLAQGGTRDALFVFTNTLKQAASGRLEFLLPEGVTTEPEAPEFDSVPPGGRAEIAFRFSAAESAPLSSRPLPFRFVYSDGKGDEITTAYLAARLTIGPVMNLVYASGQRPFFQVDAPLFRMKLDMSHGMPRHLQDDCGAVRREWSPLFTFKVNEKEMLVEDSDHTIGYTWPSLMPAGLLVDAMGNYCRFNINCTDDRFTVSMDSEWSPEGRAEFTVPGNWISPGGKPAWARVIAVDNAGKESEAKPGTKQKVAALELAFPKAEWSLAFKFKPAQEVMFDGDGLKFSIDNLAGDWWSMGFCRPGGLDEWRMKTQEEE